jgi:hypothetical protein
VSNKPAFEFTHQGFHFKVFEDGRYVVGASELPGNVSLIINRIPALIAQAQREIVETTGLCHVTKSTTKR